MSTLADAVTDATTAENNAVDALNAAAALLRNKAATAQVAVANALTVQTLYVDYNNGSDANDGLTFATPLKSVETAIIKAGASPLKVCLLSDYMFQKRVGCQGSLQIIGMQQSGNAAGYTLVNRTLSFLQVALNSPDPATAWTYGAGLFLGGASFQTNSVSFNLPDLPGGQTYTAHFQSSAGTAFSLINGNLLVSSAAAGKLIGANNSKSNVYLGLTLGTGAAGHVFDGVAAGGNPNSLYQYASNVTSG